MSNVQLPDLRPGRGEQEGTGTEARLERALPRARPDVEEQRARRPGSNASFHARAACTDNSRVRERFNSLLDQHVLDSPACALA
jgi:hypothetical protein